MHSTTGITDQFYSNMDDDLKKNRIDAMFIQNDNRINQTELEEYQSFIEWKKSR